VLAAALGPIAAFADRVRIATYQVELSRDGPGLLLRDLATGDDPQIAAIIQTLIALDADIILLTDIDFDDNLTALGLFADQLGTAGLSYPTRFALPPNTGVATGLDLDGNGRLAEARDAMGYGRFAGDGGMAILSRYPVMPEGVQDMSAFLWRDLPGAILPPDMPPDVARIQRLSTTGHWAVPFAIGDLRLTLLAWHASPPVFDGPEDRNGRRNHDETAFWLHYLAGDLPFPAPAGPFVIAGDANLDPVDGEGLPAALSSLLAHPLLQDPAPRGTSGQNDPRDTALFDAPLGGLRLDYILPSADLRIAASGVLWPPETDPVSAVLAAASRHRPVWVDITLP
jgi:Endonuclease/Exonuclease/phosphatase family